MMDGEQVFGETTMKMQTLMLGDALNDPDSKPGKAKERWIPIYKDGGQVTRAKLRIRTKFYRNSFIAGKTLFEGGKTMI